MGSDRQRWVGSVSRRGVIKAGLASVGLAVCSCSHLAEKDGGATGDSVGEITFGVFADPQYAEIKPSIGRYYRDSAAKLAQCIDTMNRQRPAFVIEMGDMIDNSGGVDADMAALKRIDGIYSQFQGPRHYVMGNHDLATLSKQQFMAAVGMPGEHYAFDCGAFRCIVLDANFTKDMAPYQAGNFAWTDSWIPPAQQRWLERELGSARKKTIVFVHQPLDDERGPHGVKNAAEVRQILEASGKVIAVFQGHNHKGMIGRIKGIAYFTLRGMVEGAGLENNAYAIVRASSAGEVEVRGFGRQASYPA